MSRRSREQASSAKIADVEKNLIYQSDMEVVVSAETREGELVGSGDGIVTGASLIGKASFSMYTGNCTYVFVRAGLVPLPGQHLCTVHPAGVIATDDGAQIWFDASSPHVGRHSWDGSAKMPDDSQLYCKPKHGYAVDKE